jgi:hypothetical protein
MRRKNIAYRLNKSFHTRLGTRDYYSPGIDVFDSDWDTLIILDACRYDTFESVSSLQGTINQVVSRGSTTNEFMKANVANRDLRDTVYVSATPAIENDKESATLHRIVNCWKEHWNSELCTVHPKKVTKIAKRVAKQYDHKRLVIHFLQPHYPFIGPTGKKFDYEGYETADGDHGTPFWDRVGMGQLDASESEIKKAYEENLRLTLPYVSDLMNTIKGKHVVTADHGEAINDIAWPIPHRIYGHPIGLYIDELVNVPWQSHVNGSRRRIIAEDPDHKRKSTDQNIIDDRLRDLGYIK